ncbi:N-6 DNA methylase [Bradyrhizobium sp. NBAIM01]|uniref:Eco57I restriction-modification methylase domain-containing protein n=1 Tax=Bradyrhizobium sp. NBAIM01 TaxID=2793818 RepID=UPI001CD1B4F5|nr:N-6 DNA methylase [Bradyrhizobium sp. NBAIM01]MCA1510452.1 N-6 DNA methylase [Bradyrhizobium sp. NBAIM01]
MAPAIDKDAPADLLKAAYEHLGFNQGALLPATAEPQRSALHEWIDKGDWQTLAAQVGAEKVFFVDREPVVVFASTADTTQAALRAFYERVWCMSRPQLLFLACPGELLVLDLTKAPPKPEESINDQSRLIAVARSIAEVQSKLLDYHRERVETGVLFGEERFSNSLNRSDRALIRDLKTVRQQLAAVPTRRGFKKPTLRDLHSLIGRAIFIRYLEDREILTPAYFEGVASRRKEWNKLLAQAPVAPAIEPRLADNRFLRVLQNKDFAYALFDQMAIDFNGDTFPIDDEERERIQQDHLDQLRGFLLGNTTGQQELFFFAYRFDVIPIELISTIYEEFYNEREGKDRNKGSHYTPPALVEFVLAQTLTPDVLAQKPRVADPACGSGIFLVESFRRIVRHLCAEQAGRRVSRPQLRKILREQIVGMDINEEAVRVAAFSLYLAFLHYQSPREINTERRLPYLKWVAEDERRKREKKSPDAQFFDILLDANSFDVISDKYPAEVTKRFGRGSATVVVGNPPWGYPKKEDAEGRKAMTATTNWCQAKDGRPLGDKELSQAFIHLTLALLRSGGRAGLLVSSGVFFKHHDNSRAFRRVWLESAKLKHVVNFAHVRHIFFSGTQREAQGISPFVSVVFDKTDVDLKRDDVHFPYWSAKRTAVVANTKAVVLSRGDMHWLSQRDCLENEKLWKIYWWGGHRDDALIRRLDAGHRLSELPNTLPGVTLTAGRGFEVLSTGTDSDWLTGYKELPAKDLVKYGPQSLRSLREVPGKVYRRGQREVYSGRRLLVGRGIKGSGFITSRFETKKYCFKNSIHGVRFKGLEEWQEAVITAIFWSSLARYYYFTTIGSWGLWHDEVHLEHVQDMPISFPESAELRERIVNIVTQLQTLDIEENFPLGSVQALDQLPQLERQLDEAVFDLYGLSLGERDLIREMCDLGLDLFYRRENSDALQAVARPQEDAGTIANLKRAGNGLTSYLRLFLQIWNAELESDSEFHWRVLSPPSGAPLIAVSFTAHYKTDAVSPLARDDAHAWRNVLATLDRVSLSPVERSKIFVDSFFRYVSDTEILFIKRNERRFWTRTAAREDAESARTFLMNSTAADVA